MNPGSISETEDSQLTLIISSPQSWDIEIDSTIKNLATQFARNHRVLYLNSPLDIMTWLRKPKTKAFAHKISVLRKEKQVLRRISDHFYVLDFPFLLFSVNQIPFAWLFDIFNYLNNRRIAKYVRKKIKELGWPEEYILYADTDIYRSYFLKELLKPSLSVYYKRDNFVIVDYWKPHGVRLEPLLMKKSDLVIVNSRYFADQAILSNPETYGVGTGVDLERFNIDQHYPEPEDMKNIPHPRMGYFGVIYTLRLDIELIAYIAAERPEYQFVFLGEEDSEFINHPLHNLKNIWFLGHKKPEELPGYVKHFDVCINPQVINEITVGNYPLKVDQYLALGKPVVATTTHTMEEFFAGDSYLASDKTVFAEQLDLALQESGNTEKIASRLALARSHTWENVSDKILKIIVNHLKNH